MCIFQSSNRHRPGNRRHTIFMHFEIWNSLVKSIMTAKCWIENIASEWRAMHAVADCNLRHRIWSCHRVWHIVFPLSLLFSPLCLYFSIIFAQNNISFVSPPSIFAERNMVDTLVNRCNLQTTVFAVHWHCYSLTYCKYWDLFMHVRHQLTNSI